MTSKKKVLGWYSIYRNTLDDYEWKIDMRGETPVPYSLYNTIRWIMDETLGHKLMEEFYRREGTDELQDWIDSLED